MNVARESETTSEETSENDNLILLRSRRLFIRRRMTSPEGKNCWGIG
jgi:hypothetical protein